MTDEPLAFSPDQFSGLARVFPLPNMVMFPHVMQALHIFEPRYLAMFEEAIQDDRLIALGLLAPGWEQQYEERPQL
jgi:Lon protease-like protein